MKARGLQNAKKCCSPSSFRAFYSMETKAHAPHLSPSFASRPPKTRNDRWFSSPVCHTSHHDQILVQERLLGFALESACTGIAVFEQRRRVYDSISSHEPHTLSVLPKDPMFGKQFRSEFKLIWNKAVDKTSAPQVAAFSSRKQQNLV